MLLQTLGPTSICDRQHGIATTFAMAIRGHYSQASWVIRYHEGCFNEHSMDLEKHGGSTLIQCKQLLMSKGIVVISASLSYPWDREGWRSIFDKKTTKMVPGWMEIFKAHWWNTNLQALPLYLLFWIFIDKPYGDHTDPGIFCRNVKSSTLKTVHHPNQCISQNSLEELGIINRIRCRSWVVKQWSSELRY